MALRDEVAVPKMLVWSRSQRPLGLDLALDETINGMALGGTYAPLLARDHGPQVKVLHATLQRHPRRPQVQESEGVLPMKFKSIVMLTASVLLAACGGWKDRLLQRATFDLNCPRSEIKADLLSDGVAGVTGCGQRATYIDHCGGYMNLNCNWALNSSRGSPSRD